MTDNILTFEAGADNAAPLLEFALAAMPGRKRTEVKQLLAHDQIAVNGAPTRQFDAPLAPGDRVEVNLTRAFHVFRNRRIQIVYEDDDIIVVNKGYGLLSVAADNQRRRDKEGRAQETAYSIMREYVKQKDPANKLFIVHRLDRDTSGLMMFAKSAEIQEALRHNWNNTVLDRTYDAVVEGTLDPPEGARRSYLAENSRYEVYSTDDPEKGKLAVTRYKTLKSGCGYTLAQVSLDTGRKNQIRVHMKEPGHPISGDRRYGAKASPIGRLCLHAQTLRFAHPRTRRLMDFSTPVPAKFWGMVGGKAGAARPGGGENAAENVN